MKNNLQFLKGMILIALFVLTPQGAFPEHEALKSYKEQKYQKALGEFDRILKKYPELEEAHFGKGAVLYKQKKYDEALKEFENSLSVEDPIKKSQIFYNMGNALVQNQRASEAIQFYKKALELNPADYDAKFNLELVKRQVQQQSGQNKENNKKDNTQQNQSEQQQKQQQKQDQQQSQQQQQKQKSSSDKIKQDDQEKKQAAQILDAMRADEKNKMKEYIKSKMSGIQLEKDW